MSIVFVSARTWYQLMSNAGSVAARAFGGDTQWFAVLITLAAGYTTALIAKRRQLLHAGMLAVFVATLALAPSYSVVTEFLGDIFAGAPPSFQQWLFLLGGDVLPAALPAAMILLGGALRVWQPQNPEEGLRVGCS
jgi:hypothetical protein